MTNLASLPPPTYRVVVQDTHTGYRVLTYVGDQLLIIPGDSINLGIGVTHGRALDEGLRRCHVLLASGAARVTLEDISGSRKVVHYRDGRLEESPL